MLRLSIRRVLANPADIARYQVEFYNLARSIKGADKAGDRSGGTSNFEQLVELGKGNRLEFRDFGVFDVRERAERVAQNPKTLERVQVPEWGGEVCVREMTAGERDRWDAWQIDHTGPDRFNDLRARLLVTVLCDDAGARLFSDADIEHVSRMPASIITRIWSVAVDLAGLTGDQEKKS